MTIVERDIQEAERPKSKSNLSEIWLPPYEVSNQTLAEFLSEKGVKTGTGKDVTAEGISQTTGIDCHYYLQGLGEKPRPLSETVPEIATQVALTLIEKRGWRPHEVNRIIVCSSYPFGQKISDNVAQRIGASKSQNFDSYAACSSSTFALKILQEQPNGGKSLLIAAEHYSSQLPDDLNRSIFSDGGAGLAFEDSIDFKIIDSTSLIEPSNVIKMPIEDKQFPYDSFRVWNPESQGPFEMEGKKVLRWVTQGTPADLTTNSYQQAKEHSERIFIIPHQGSGRLIADYEAALRRRGVKAPVSSLTVRQTGNLASASILGELNAFLSKNHLQKGDIIILSGFGAGLATAVVTFQVQRDIHPAA